MPLISQLEQSIRVQAAGEYIVGDVSVVIAALAFTAMVMRSEQQKGLMMEVRTQTWQHPGKRANRTCYSFPHGFELMELGGINASNR